jgi:hypothetical protein
MDLPTHYAFGLAIGLVFFGRVDVALVVGLGALLPDLDREYWYLPEKKYAEEQRHRALFHNVVIIAASYLASPFLALGVFLHVLQDSFTTVKDRGVEWFYPFTRLVKRGVHKADGPAQPPVPGEQIYFYQEDPPELVKLADPDLQEAADRPVPWRRVYGFAQNSHLLDRGFLFGSFALVALWVLTVWGSKTAWVFGFGWRAVVLAYAAVVALYASGETQSSQERAREKLGQAQAPVVKSRLAFLRPIQVPLLLVGLGLFAISGILDLGGVAQYEAAIVPDPTASLAGVAVIIAVAVIVVKWQTRGGRTTVV